MRHDVIASSLLCQADLPVTTQPVDFEKDLIHVSPRQLKTMSSRLQPGERAMTFRIVLVVADGTVMGASIFGAWPTRTKCISNARWRLPERSWQPRIGTVISSMAIDLGWIALGHYGAERRRDTVASFRIERQDNRAGLAEWAGKARRRGFWVRSSKFSERRTKNFESRLSRAGYNRYRMLKKLV